MAVQLRQSYRIISEQMQIIAKILPQSAPLAEEQITNLQDITNWVDLHKNIWENTGITKIKTTTTTIEDNEITKQNQIFNIKGPNIFEQKTVTENTNKENQTDEAEFITINRRQNKKQTVEIEPPAIHPTLKEIDEIRLKFSTAKLTANCGTSTTNGKSENDYFANARKRPTWFVQSWQNSILYPLDVKTKERFDFNVQMVEGMLEECDTETEKLLMTVMSKAYRTVKGSFRYSNAEEYYRFEGIF